MNLALAKIKYRQNWKPKQPFMKSAGAPAQLQTHPSELARSMRLSNLRKNNFKVNQDYENQLKLSDSRRRYQLRQTEEIEYNRLLSASTHGLLQGRAQERMEDLKTLLNI
jgi:hypothetical protein